MAPQSPEFSKSAQCSWLLRDWYTSSLCGAVLPAEALLQRTAEVLRLRAELPKPGLVMYKQKEPSPRDSSASASEVCKIIAFFFGGGCL